ncbi:MAG: DUF4250 domain-containing protein [Acutalibacteraceae bacterium]|nr:DUF4250 domain-containing protein [Acutalibacteraceae bacterium]
MNIPKDPVMLLSYINTQLRDYYSSLTALCDDKNLNITEITEKLKFINYEYDEQLNKFI